MKNTLITFLLIITLALGLCGCGSEVEVKESEEVVEEMEEVEEETEESEKVAETSAPTVAVPAPTSPAPGAAPAQSDADLEARYQSLIEAYDELQLNLAQMSGDTKGLSRDAMTDLANKKNQLQSTHGKYTTAGGDSLRKIYVSQLDTFESSYWTVKNKYRVE